MSIMGIKEKITVLGIDSCSAKLYLTNECLLGILLIMQLIELRHNVKINRELQKWTWNI